MPDTSSNTPGAWIAVASAEHVRRGRREGFMQVCHGKRGPLARLRPGDRVAYYSPTVSFGGHDRLQAFTALGTVRPGEPYAFDMGGGFVPFRRDVVWDDDTRDAAIAPLLGRLSFTAGRSHWGQAFRFGLLRVSPQDLDHIAEAMRKAGAAAGTDVTPIAARAATASTGCGSAPASH